MKKIYSKYWKGSKKPRKQRKYLVHSSLKDKRRFISAHLSKELQKKYGKRSLAVKKDDEVVILRGQFKKVKGKVVKVFLRKSRIYIESAHLIKRDGSKVYYPIHPSNVMISALNLDDRERIKIFDRVKNVTSQTTGSS